MDTTLWTEFVIQRKSTSCPEKILFVYKFTGHVQYTMSTNKY